MLKTILACVSCGLLTVPLCAADDPAYVELGRVHFERDLDAGLAAAKLAKKPVFLLFDEVPGCATCQGFGRGPLSEPLVVEAIETLFTPIAVFNNRGGADGRALARFGESAWNNPVVRFVDCDGRDLLQRKDGVWTTPPLVDLMIAALEKSGTGHQAPLWLELVQFESRPAHRLVLAMDCFWDGQAKLGGQDGVIDVRPGYVGGAEVCDVRFDPRTTTGANLVKAARDLGVARTVYTLEPGDERTMAEATDVRAQHLGGEVRPASASDDLRHLRTNRSLVLLPLTRVQRLRVNSALARDGQIPAGVLSPRQSALRARIAAARESDLEGLVPPDDPALLATCEALLVARLDRANGSVGVGR